MIGYLRFIFRFWRQYLILPTVYLAMSVVYAIGTISTRSPLPILAAVYVLMNAFFIISALAYSFPQDRPYRKTGKSLLIIFAIIMVLLTPRIFICTVYSYALLAKPCGSASNGMLKVCFQTSALFGDLYIVDDPSDQLALEPQERLLEWREYVEGHTDGELASCSQGSYKIEKSVYQVYAHC